MKNRGAVVPKLLFIDPWL